MKYKYVRRVVALKQPPASLAWFLNREVSKMRTHAKIQKKHSPIYPLSTGP